MRPADSSNKLWRRRDVIKLLGATAITGPAILRATTANAATSKVIKIGPKVVTVGKALLFPASVAALGSRADGLSTEIWWSPSHPFKSGLTGKSAKELCGAYEHSTGRPWTQPIGFQHALFEVAIDVLKRAKNLGEPASILEAIVATDYHSVVGPIKWSSKPVKNVSKTPLVAGQWRKRDTGFELNICEDATAPNIKAQDKLRLLG